MDRLQKRGGQVTEMRQTGNRKEMDRLQTGGGPILQKIGGQVTEKRWTGYRKEVARLQKRGGQVTEKR